MLHAIREDVGPLSRGPDRKDQTYYDPYSGLWVGWNTLCGKTAEQVGGCGCYPSAFVDCPACRKVMDE